MRYHVRARFPDEGKKEEFLKILTDGTVSALKPFGEEIAAAMRRAVRKEGRIEWTETCYCGPPSPRSAPPSTTTSSRTSGPRPSRIPRP